jgi:RHS repeat-associated protein
MTGLGVDDIFRRTDSAGARDFIRDALGSTLALADDTGVLTTQYTYDPYGRTTTTGASSANPFQYTGRENDGTGLYYYRARYYGPDYGRFITSDPIGLRGGLNTYSYVHNNPLSRIDPTGLLDQDVVDLCMQIDGNPLECLIGQGDDIMPSPATEAKAGGTLVCMAKNFRKKPGSLGKSKGKDALQRENKGPNDAAKDTNLDAKQRNILHKEVQQESQHQGRPLKYQEILDLIRDIFGK